MDKKKKITRIVLFALFFIIAITAFSIGVVSLSENKTGYRTISANPDEEALLYANDFVFKYYFEGRSAQIKEEAKQVTAAYSTAMLRAYKFLDPAVSYAGYSNIATLNECTGEPVKVGRELYAVLKDAYAKTLENNGYNMFAGPLYGHVYSILILSDPYEFDPAVNRDERERRQTLSRLCSDLSHFELKFVNDEEYTVSFTVDAEFRDALSSMEEEFPIIDLNLLHDAYMMEFVRNALAESGYLNGYITTRSGLMMALSAQKDSEYCFYGLKDGMVSILDTFKPGSAAVASCFKSISFGDEDYYYSFEADGKLYRRCPYINAFDGYENDEYLSFYSVCTGDGLIRSEGYVCSDTVFNNIKCLFGGEAQNDPRYMTAYVLTGDPSHVFRSDN